MNRLLRQSAFMVALMFPVTSQAAPSTGSRANDFGDSLLSGDLDELLEQLPGVAPAPRSAPDVGEDLGAEQSQPLNAIAQGMAQSKGLIREGQVAAAPQKQVIADLDELIRQAEKLCQACQNPSSGSSSSQAKQQSQRSQPKPKPSEKAGQPKPSQKPGDEKKSQQAAQQSTARLGSGAARSADARGADDHMKEIWGRLPQRLREQMLESSSDEFLPEYREEIERYYRRLAEEPQP